MKMSISACMSRRIIYRDEYIVYRSGQTYRCLEGSFWLSGGSFLPNFIVERKFSNPFVIFVLEWALVGKIFKLEPTFFDLPC